MAEYRFGNIERIYDTDADGVRTLYLTRLHLGRLFVHFFNRGDMDRSPHDHPWDFWTFPLTTYYEEVWKVVNYWGGAQRAVCINKKSKVRRFRIHFRPANYIHRVLHPAPGKRIITLVFRSAKYRSWGFWSDGRWVHHRKYL